jgi:hypothetical protein
MLVVFSTPGVAEFCKWVDENGVVHYADTCPENVDSAKVETAAPPSQSQVKEADKRFEQLQEKRKARKESTSAQPSLSLTQLGPLPENESSKYLTTTGTGILMDFQELVGQFTIHLKAKRSLSPGAYLEAHFPNPASSSNPAVVGKLLEKDAAEIFILAPKSKGFKCWNYEVEVFVYRDSAKSLLLDTHHQSIQSRVDLDKVRNGEELLKATLQGNCPSAQSAKPKSVKELEALCEQERERGIAPLREAEIKKCKAGKEKVPEYCERYYSDYGDGGISGRYVRPRMFDNLSECVEARKVRAEADRR